MVGVSISIGSEWLVDESLWKFKFPKLTCSLRGRSLENGDKTLRLRSNSFDSSSGMVMFWHCSTGIGGSCLLGVVMAIETGILAGVKKKFAAFLAGSCCIGISDRGSSASLSLIMTRDCLFTLHIGVV